MTFKSRAEKLWYEITSQDLNGAVCIEQFATEIAAEARLAALEEAALFFNQTHPNDSKSFGGVITTKQAAAFIRALKESPCQD